MDKFENEPRMSKFEKQKWESMRIKEKKTRRVNERGAEVIFKVFEQNIQDCFKIYLT